jgi:hypothetical protein|tara:strand:+ start:3482 stop:4351 length:870 start_codon:yes stop_codon:yes gene_type:complete
MSSFLQNHQRQPKLFVDLPSKGKWYTDSCLQDMQSTSVPVYGMNAMDEILFKTPDALFTGRATAEVIHSCIPTILDPWELVGYDIDFILISMRISTYGDDMPVTTNCPKCSTENQSRISLGKLLEGFDNYPLDFKFEEGGFEFNIRPITYKKTSEFSMQNYALQRELWQVQQIERTEANALDLEKKLQDVYARTSLLNLELAVSHIESIAKDGEIESDLEEVSNFIKTSDMAFYAKLKDKIFELTQKWNFPLFDVVCENEECNHKYKTNLDIDYSNFFGVSSLNSRNLI